VLAEAPGPELAVWLPAGDDTAGGRDDRVRHSGHSLPLARRSGPSLSRRDKHRTLCELLLAVVVVGRKP
jgi:hypothetical protein